MRAEKHGGGAKITKSLSGHDAFSWGCLVYCKFVLRCTAFSNLPFFPKDKTYPTQRYVFTFPWELVIHLSQCSQKIRLSMLGEFIHAPCIAWRHRVLFYWPWWFLRQNTPSRPIFLCLMSFLFPPPPFPSWYYMMCLGSIPGSGRSPGEGNGNPLQYSCLGNPMDRGAWWATVQGVIKSQIQLSD